MLAARKLKQTNSRLPDASGQFLGKSKLLAVFLGPVSWIYTYDQNKKQFWIGISVQWALALIFGTLSLVVLLKLQKLDTGLTVERFVEHADGLL